MKKQILLATVILQSAIYNPQSAICQNIGINTMGNAPNSSAALDIDINQKGLLVPRMSTANRNAIVSPANSLLIFNTTTDCFEAWNQTTLTWVAFGCINCQLPGVFSISAATSITPTSFSANWTASAGATNYYLDVATDVAFTAFIAGYNNLNVGNVATYNVTGLSCGTYYYRVRANNACGTSTNSSISTVPPPSLPVYAANAASEQTANLTSQSANLPPSISSGDLLLLYTSHNISNTGIPAGWTELTGGGNFNHCFYKVATGAEGSTVTWTTSAGCQTVAIALRITGSNSTTPIQTNSWAGFIAGSGPTVVAPSVTSTTCNTLLIQFFSHINGGGGSMTEDNGVTEIVDYVPPFTVWNSVASYKALPTGGASGATTATLSVAKESRNGISIIVAP